MQRVEVKATASRYDARRDDTASKIVVGSEDLQRYGDTSVLDAFKRVPGITVDGGQVKMRGLGSGYTQILINGERAPAGFTLDSLSPDMIEKIEILRAASAEYSTQSIAGTINIILKKTVRVAQRDLKVSVADSGQSFTPSTTLLLAGRSEGVNLTPRLSWTLDSGGTLSSQSYMGMSKAGGDGGTAVTTPLGDPLAYDRIAAQSGVHSAYLHSDLDLVHKMDDGAKFDVKIGVDASRSTNAGTQLGASDGTPALDRTIAADSRENGVTSTGKYTAPLGDDHTLAVGWEGGYTKRDEGRIQQDAVLPGYVPDDGNAGYTAGVGRLAFFAQDDWAITPLWSLYAGLRWEGISTRSDGNSFAAVRNRASVWSPLLQSLWKLPNMQDQVRLALTRTFKAPTLDSLTPRLITSTNNSQSAPDVQGNPNLKPELATGLDTSFDHYLDKDGALLSASASMRRIDNYTRQGLLLQNERWVAMPVNEGNATTRSVELEAKLPLKSLLGPALGAGSAAQVPAVDLHASVSRNWSQVDAVPGPDNRLDGQVPLSANLGIDYKTADGALSTGGNFNFRNGGPLRISDTQTAYLTPRRDLDMYALWKIDPKYQLRLALDNLLGQDYQSENGYADASGTLVRNATYPSSVQARATFEVKF